MSEQPMVEPAPATTDLDLIADWVDRLAAARKAKKLAEEVEKECREKIEEMMLANSAQVGLVKGTPVLKLTTISKRQAPSVAVLEQVAPQILEQYGKRITYTTLSLIK